MKTYLLPEEVERLEEAADCLRDRLLIRMLFFLTCRIKAILSITTQDINFEQGTVSVIHLKQRIKVSCSECNVRLSKDHMYCPKCGLEIEQVIKQKFEQRHRQILPLEAKTLEMLKGYVERGGPVNRNGQLLIFGINRYRAWQIVTKCADAAGLPKLVNPETGKIHNVSPHRLRDAFAVNAVKKDGSADGIRMLQEHLDHQSISTTMKYRKVAGEEHRKWYDKLFKKESKD